MGLAPPKSGHLIWMRCNPMPSTTLRALARRCAVSAATVSRALSGHPNVRPEVRARVEAVAREQGYTRNHLVGSIMSQVRAARAQRFLGNLAIVHVPSAQQPRPRPMQQGMMAAAAARALELGFELGIFRLDRARGGAAALGRVLRARGVQGVIFIYSQPTEATRDFPWDYFASVEIDYGSTQLLQHTVSIDHYLTLTNALSRLRGLGYERMGLFLERHKDERLVYKWSAAFRSFQEMQGGIGSAPVLMATVMEPAPFLAWQRAHKLDLVIGHVDQAVTWLRQHVKASGKTPGFFNLNWNERSGDCAGLDLRPELQGKAAVESIVAQIHRNERGLPADPQSIMLSGRWVDGPTVRAGAGVG